MKAISNKKEHENINTIKCKIGFIENPQYGIDDKSTIFDKNDRHQNILKLFALNPIG